MLQLNYVHSDKHSLRDSKIKNYYNKKNFEKEFATFTIASQLFLKIIFCP